MRRALRVTPLRPRRGVPSLSPEESFWGLYSRTPVALWCALPEATGRFPCLPARPATLAGISVILQRSRLFTMLRRTVPSVQQGLLTLTLPQLLTLTTTSKIVRFALPAHIEMLR